jgi:putative proteasome-type protease
MDSTIRSNLSVWPPLDLVLVKRDRCEVARHINIDHHNAYFAGIRRRWSEALREVFKHLPEPDWLRSPSGLRLGHTGSRRRGG